MFHNKQNNKDNENNQNKPNCENELKRLDYLRKSYCINIRFNWRQKCKETLEKMEEVAQECFKKTP